MAVKTNWHEDAATVGTPGLDPFELSASGAAMSSAPLSLDLPIAQLTKRLGDLMRQEAHLFEEGIVCPIKENPEGTCLGCPLNEAKSASAKGSLCQLGCEQERLQTMILAKNARPNR